MTFPFNPIQDKTNEVREQYENAEKLKTRISLHEKFSINPYGWQHWIFDQLVLPPVCKVLELGCGPGNLWKDNLGLIPPGWEITLSDFSEGMLKIARCTLEGQRSFEFKQIDACMPPLPFETEQFDAVIANHMLFYVPDRPALFAEIRRVLKCEGHLYATTTGRRHLQEMVEIAGHFDAGMINWGSAANPFTLENGGSQLSPWFANISLRRYEDALMVREAGPLVEYILSGWKSMPESWCEDFKRFVQTEMDECGGVIYVTKDSGMFIAEKN
jgi:ubiquinone/menaquinone biosynthesis C-methylase UbiE